MKKHRIAVTIICFVLISLSVLPAVYAAEIPSYGESGRVLTVSHGGDRYNYPANSIKAVTSAFDYGADFVSVTVQKTTDNEFFVSDYDDLGEMYHAYSGIVISSMTKDEVDSKMINLTDSLGNPSNEKMPHLSDIVSVAKAYGKTVIVDNGWGTRNELYSYLINAGAVESAVLRTSADNKEISEFLRITDGNLSVIGFYYGNIIYKARRTASRLIKDDCAVVQLGTKNPFGVIFNKSMLSVFSKNGYKTRAMIAAYDPYLCGQRSDSDKGWNEFIDRGFSVIETNDIASLTSYVTKLRKTRDSLIDDVNSVSNLNLSNCSNKSKKEIETARNNASSVLTTLSSLDTLQEAENKLVFALSTRTVNDGDQVKKGVLNITAGKTVAVVLVGLALVAGQVYAFKMQGMRKAEKTADKKQRTK